MRKVSAAAVLAIALVATTLDLLGSPQRNLEPLTNQAVVKLLGAGLSEDIVVRMVKTLPGNCALGPDDLVELKKAGASNEIIRAMMERQPAAVPAPADPVPGPGAAIDSAAPAPAKSPARRAEGTAPNVPFEPGLYAQGKDGFARIEGQAMSFQRSGSRLQSTVTFGIRSAKTNSQMLGKDAGNKVEGAPTFFYRVASGNEASGGTAGDLILAKLKVKGDRRQFELGASGAGRDSAGLSIRSQIECRRTAVAPGLYRIRPASELKAGQYAFYLFRAQLPPLVYDFEVE